MVDKQYYSLVLLAAVGATPRGRVARDSREMPSSSRTQSVGSLDTLDWSGGQEEML